MWPSTKALGDLGRNEGCMGDDIYGAILGAFELVSCIIEASGEHFQMVTLENASHCTFIVPYKIKRSI
jgi:hypothetical protein